jgi:5-formyltetrahydrofolate cyclo-ligase
VNRSGDTGEIARAKREVRDLVLARRDALLGEERAARSRALLAHLTALPAVVAARTILCFVSFRSEVDTGPIVDWCFACGTTVAVPKVEGRRHMEAYRLDDPAADLVEGHFGVLEPRPGLAPLDPAEVDAVIVPGAAFDLDGGRMGYGGGFYDNYVGRLRPAAVCIGIAFDVQLVGRVPLEPHDRCVDVIVTDERVIETGCRDGGSR